jgi:hypothetical protein
MKQVLLLALATASFAVLGTAAPCATASLAAYSAASFSCTIGGDTFSNFSVLMPFIGSQIDNTIVTITPSGGTYNPTLTFSLSPTQTTSAQSPIETTFTYLVSGSPFTGISTNLSGSSETADGAVDDIINFCEGGGFGPDGVTGCLGTTGSLVTVDGAQNDDMSGLGKSTTLAVTDDFTIDPGLSGTATAGTFTNSLTAIPEPLTSSLTGLGLLLVGALKFRASRAKQESNKEE